MPSPFRDRILPAIGIPQPTSEAVICVLLRMRGVARGLLGILAVGRYTDSGPITEISANAHVSILLQAKGHISDGITYADPDRASLAGRDRAVQTFRGSSRMACEFPGRRG